MVAIVSGLVGFLLVLLVGKLSQRFPEMTVVGYAERLVGRWPGKFLAVALAILLSLNASADIRTMLRGTVGFYYMTTPTWVIGLLMAVVALSLVWFGPVNAARIVPIMLTALFLTFLFTFPLLLRWIRPGFLRPLFDFASVDLRGNGFWSSLGSLRSGLALAVLFPYIQEPTRAVRTYGLAFWFGWFAVFLATIFPIMLFSVEGARAIGQPFPEVLSVIRLANFPIERIEMLARLGYSLNILFAVGMSFFGGGHIWADLFGSTRMRPFMLLATAVALFPIFLLTDVVLGRALTAVILSVTLVSVFTIYPVLWLVYWIRGAK